MPNCDQCAGKEASDTFSVLFLSTYQLQYFLTAQYCKLLLIFTNYLSNLSPDSDPTLRDGQTEAVICNGFADERENELAERRLGNQVLSRYTQNGQKAGKERRGKRNVQTG